MDNQSSFFAQVLHELGISATLVASLIIAGTTSLVVYLNRVKNGNNFAAFSLVVNIAVSVVIAFMVDAAMRYVNDGVFNSNLAKATMVVVGVTSNKILELVETYGSKYFEKKAKNITNEE